MTTYFSASNAMNDYDPVGATSPRKCSAQNLKFVLVGLNFLNYNGWLHPDIHRLTATGKMAFADFTVLISFGLYYHFRSSLPS